MHEKLSRALFGLAEIHGLIGVAFRKQGRFPDARAAFEKALELRRQNLGEVSAQSLMSLRDLAGVHREAGQLDEARTLAERAKELVERLPPYEALEASILVELAQVLVAQKKDADAQPLLVQALSLQEESLGDGNSQTIQTMRLLAELHERRKHPEKAEPLRKRLPEEVPDTIPRCMTVVPALRIVADMYRRGGDMQTPVELARRGLAVVQEAFGPEDPNTVAVREELAEVEAASRAAAGRAAKPAARGGARP